VTTAPPPCDPAARTDAADNNALAEARALFAANDLVGARKRLESALQEQPDDYDIIHLLGLVQFQLGERELAAWSLMQAYRNLDPTPSLIYTLGGILRQLGRRDEALAVLRAGVARFPENGPMRTNLGSALLDAGDYKAADAELRLALEWEPRNPVTFNRLVALHSATNDTGKAREYGRRGLRLKDELAHEEFARLDAETRPSLRPAACDCGKKVIAFSLFGADATYVEGAVQNALLAPKVYPGWIARFYADATVPAGILSRLRGAGAECILVDGEPGRMFGTFWRFFASDDPTVARFVCRNADCRLNAREYAAVEEWLASGADFHVMRDHLWHNDLILAGFWGGRGGRLPDIASLALRHCGERSDKWGDQVFLGNFIWPLIKEHCLIHDSHFDLFGARKFPPHPTTGQPDHVGRTFPLQTTSRTLKIQFGPKR
jgi:tetratricopeptide (TPR) repeat protein